MKIHILPVFILALGMAPAAQAGQSTAAPPATVSGAAADITGVDRHVAGPGVAKTQGGKDVSGASMFGNTAAAGIDGQAAGEGAVGAWIYALFGAAALGFGWLLFRRLSRRA